MELTREFDIGGKVVKKLALLLIFSYFIYGGNLYPHKEIDSFGYIDENGTIKIEPKYGYASYFSEDLAAVSFKSSKNISYTIKLKHHKTKIKKKTKYYYIFGYINKHGKQVIKPRFSYAGDFCNGFAIVQHKKKGKFAFVNKKGKFITGYRFRAAHNFKGGLAIVKDVKKWGCINKKGKCADYSYLFSR